LRLRKITKNEVTCAVFKTQVFQSDQGLQFCNVVEVIAIFQVKFDQIHSTKTVEYDEAIISWNMFHSDALYLITQYKVNNNNLCYNDDINKTNELHLTNSRWMKKTTGNEDGQLRVAHRSQKVVLASNPNTPSIVIVHSVQKRTAECSDSLHPFATLVIEISQRN